MQTSEKTKGPSLGKIEVKVPRQRSPYAMKFEDRSQEEIEDKSGAPQRRVEIGQEHLKAPRNGQGYFLLTYHHP